MLGKIIPSQEKRTTLFACGHEAFTALPMTEQKRARQTTVVISTKYRTGQGDDTDIEYGYRLSEDGLRREVAVDPGEGTGAGPGEGDGQEAEAGAPAPALRSEYPR